MQLGAFQLTTAAAADSLFWQLAGDLAVGLAPPYGHGHRYGPELVAVWAAVLGGHPGDNYETLISAMRPHVPTAE